jgi:hypothetical protein
MQLVPRGNYEVRYYMFTYIVASSGWMDGQDMQRGRSEFPMKFNHGTLYAAFVIHISWLPFRASIA